MMLTKEIAVAKLEDARVKETALWKELEALEAQDTERQRLLREAKTKWCDAQSTVLAWRELLKELEAGNL